MADSYVAIDLETTGLAPKYDKIIEVGAIRVEGGTVTETFSTLICPHRKLEERTVSITGITDEMLKGQPDIGEVIGQIVNFSGDLPLLGHHVIFDYSFLKRAAVNCGLKFEKRGIDTLHLCRKFMPPEEKKSLSCACRYFGIEQVNSHRAAADAEAARLLYEELLKRFGKTDQAAFSDKPLVCKVKREQPAGKRQKEHLIDLIKYHKIDLSVQIDYMTKSEISRLTDKIISHYGRL